MSVVKQINDKGATIAWSPLRNYASLLATGTKEGGGGGFDDYGGELAIHSFDLANRSLDCNVIASVKTPQRFSSLAWGAMGGNRPALRSGLIVGGMADGVVNVWDAAALMNGSGDNAAVAMIERHATSVRCVQFNPHQAAQHLIAAGSTDGDISIINLDAPASPTVASPMGGGQRLESEITSLAWNTSVTHILATATLGGTVVVWDLKENKPWCQLRDPHRASVSDVVWAPNDGLYLVTACDDDSRPVLRLWDLRSSTTTPLCEFVGHTKGVLSVDWCPHDPNLLVSCGKDAHTFIWDIQQGRAIAEVPGGGGSGGSGSGSGGSGATPRQTGAGGGAGLGLGAGGFGGPSDVSSSNNGFPGAGGFGGPTSASNVFGAPAGAAGGGGGVDAVFGTTLAGIGGGAGRRYSVRWSKHLPATLAACSLDRRITLHSATALGPVLSAKSAMPGAAGQQAAVEATLRRAPRWLRRPVGAAFGFGGKLVTFGAPLAAVRGDLRAGAVPFAKTVNIASVTTDHDFVSRALAFEQSLAAVEAGTMDVRAFCDGKVAAASGAGDSKGAAVWGFLRLLFEPDARHHVLAYLGYDAPRVAAEVSAYAGRDVMAVVKPQEAAAAAASPAEVGTSSQQQQRAGLDVTTSLLPDGTGINAGAGATPGGGDVISGNGPASSPISGGLEQAQALARSQSSGAIGGWPLSHASAEDVFGGANNGSANANAPNSTSAADIFSAASPTGEDAAQLHSSVKGAVTSNANAAAGGSPPGHARSRSHTSATAGGVGSPAGAASSSSSSSSSTGAVDEVGAMYVKRRVPSPADEAVLKKALLVGDFPAAVGVCLKQDRLDDALLLAACGSPELWAATQEEYFKRRASPLMSVMAGVIKGDLTSLVSSCPLADWRETLALLCTYARAEEFCALCEALGDRLAVEEGDAHSATLAYMAARAVSKTILIWTQEARDRGRTDAGGVPGALHELVEKVVVFRRAVALASAGAPGIATGTDGSPQPEAASFGEYVLLLASEGYLATAATFAQRVSDSPMVVTSSSSAGVAAGADVSGGSPVGGEPLGSVLRDRLARAFSRNDYASPAAQAVAASAVFPFPLSNIGPAPPPPPAALPSHPSPSQAAGGVAGAGAYGYDVAAAAAAATGGYDAYGNATSTVTQQYDAYGNPIYPPQQPQQPLSARGAGGYQQQMQQMQQPQASAAGWYGGQPQQQQMPQAPVAAPYSQQPAMQPQAAYGRPSVAPLAPVAAPAAPSYTTFTPNAAAAAAAASSSSGGGMGGPHSMRPPLPPQPQQQQPVAAVPQQQQPQGYGNVGYQPQQMMMAQPQQQQQQQMAPQQSAPTSSRVGPAISTFNPAAVAPASMPAPASMTSVSAMMMMPPPASGYGQQQMPVAPSSSFGASPMSGGGAGAYGGLQQRPQTGQAPAAAAAPAPPPAPIPIPPEVTSALEQMGGTIAALGGLQLAPHEVKQLQEATASIDVIKTKFTGGQVSPDAAAKLVALGAQLASYDFAGANRTQMELAQVDWGRTKEWHKGVRYLTTLALVKSGATAR